MNQFDFKLNVISLQPVHLQLAYVLERAIDLGRLPAHSRLPSVRSLAATFSISKTAVLEVYGSLEDQGKLYRGTEGDFYVSERYDLKGRAAAGLRGQNKFRPVSAGLPSS
ncbi:GntR family transcriptional regulator [Pedobacter sp. SYSU D00535]|uniref:GntR family transcriptional regulator n=1 Tax=Pedobacter sp. SYSU D00535 TaxID=2810308 RepID=UPI001A9630C7|nr:GntR family transcriptional regulator [Pedobacter sp. SYSU D00535]